MSGPVHVVQVNPYLDPEGREPEALLEAWPTLLAAAAAAVEAGVAVTVLQACHHPAAIERRGVRLRFLPPPDGTSGRRMARRAASLLPDVVHLHGLGYPGHMRRLARECANAPLLVQDRGERVPPLWRRLSARRALGRAAAVGFTAPEQARSWIRAGALPSRVRVVPLLKASSRFTPGDRATARAATGLEGDPAVLWVGRLDSEKDPHTALEAVARAASELPDLRLWCCFTDAPLLDEVRARISADERLADRVTLLGEVPHGEIQELCRAADLFLSASRREGSGHAMIEALACGLPAVATDIPCFRRFTDGGRIGALAPPGDAGALASALVTEAGRDREHARREARLHFERKLSFEALGHELRKAYEGLLSPEEGPAEARVG
jgi:glycosyltransferase involved in cell wall biosynthesis